ncbi:DUF4199 domain-containing protein [Mucilaginibacter agri]|uniref:DUF4199 family protein n=1 Tax=Mucilaginibacter agri TaxID=2695265 RepID=A0A965ZG78_9SPHI|nr:DUF4199 domain-containing protein [Mucilaginibacter agri]NCD70085.1 DUF4199 family protein [Mucilaginibacter agri]
MTISDKDIRKKAAMSGLLLGVIVIVMTIFSFYYVTTMASSPYMVSFGPLIFSVTIPIVVAVFFAIDLRKKIGGYWNFKQAVTGFFVMFLVSYAVNYVGTNLLFAKVIEPQMVEKTQEAVKNASAKIMEEKNVDQEKIDEQMEKIQKQFDEQKEDTPTKVIAHFGISIIMIFVVAMIFAAIFKKEQPRYLTDDYQAPADPTV